MSKFCEKCGNQLSNEAKFCNKCGTKINCDVQSKNVKIPNILGQSVYQVQSKEPVAQNADIPNNTQNNVYVGFSSTNETTQVKNKKFKKPLFIICVAVVLVLGIMAGIILIPGIFSGGKPKIIKIDDNKSVFDLSYEQFREGIVKNVDTLFEIFGSNIPSEEDRSKKSDEELKRNYINKINDDNYWTSWTDVDAKWYKWEWGYSESLSQSIELKIDLETNKIISVNTQSYYPDIFTKSLITSYILYGNDIDDQKLETLYNLSYLCYNAYSENIPFFLDDLLLAPHADDDDKYDPIYTFTPITEKTIDALSSTAIKIDKDNLMRFDKILSARYGITFQWHTLDEIKQTKNS